MTNPPSRKWGSLARLVALAAVAASSAVGVSANGSTNLNSSSDPSLLRGLAADKGSDHGHFELFSQSLECAYHGLASCQAAAKHAETLGGSKCGQRPGQVVPASFQFDSGFHPGSQEAKDEQEQEMAIAAMCAQAGSDVLVCDEVAQPHCTRVGALGVGCSVQCAKLHRRSSEAGIQSCLLQVDILSAHRFGVCDIRSMCAALGKEQCQVRPIGLPQSAWSLAQPSTDANRLSNSRAALRPARGGVGGGGGGTKQGPTIPEWLPMVLTFVGSLTAMVGAIYFTIWAVQRCCPEDEEDGEARAQVKLGLGEEQDNTLEVDDDEDEGEWHQEDQKVGRMRRKKAKLPKYAVVKSKSSSSLSPRADEVGAGLE